MDLTIREMTSADLGPRFLETLAGLSEVGLSVREAEEVARHRLGHGIRTYVALCRGQIVGTASLLLEGKFLHRGGLVGHIEDVAVHRDFRLRGTGTAVVGYATEEARSWAATRSSSTASSTWFPSMPGWATVRTTPACALISSNRGLRKRGQGSGVRREGTRGKSGVCF